MKPPIETSGGAQDASVFASKDLLCCPFCGVTPIAYDGDYVVNHTSDCYITHVTGNVSHHWLVRKRIAKWQTRQHNDESCGASDASAATTG